MDDAQEQHVRIKKLQLALYEAMALAVERRHEVVDAIHEAEDLDDARRRLRTLLSIGGKARAVLDMQFRHLSSVQSAGFRADLGQLRAAASE